MDLGTSTIVSNMNGMDIHLDHGIIPPMFQAPQSIKGRTFYDYGDSQWGEIRVVEFHNGMVEF